MINKVYADHFELPRWVQKCRNLSSFGDDPIDEDSNEYDGYFEEIGSQSGSSFSIRKKEVLHFFDKMEPMKSTYLEVKNLDVIDEPILEEPEEAVPFTEFDNFKKVRSSFKNDKFMQSLIRDEKRGRHGQESIRIRSISFDSDPIREEPYEDEMKDNNYHLFIRSPSLINS